MMKRSQIRITGLIRRWSSIALIIALTAGSVSLASFAYGAGGTKGVFGIHVTGNGAGGLATASQAAAEMGATPSNLAELLEQGSDMAENVVPTSFQVLLNGETVVDSDRWGLTFENGKKIAADSKIRHQLAVKFYPRAGDGLEAGDGVTWYLGTIEGLDLEREFWEPLEILGRYIADVWLYYGTDGGIYLYTEFAEDISKVGNFTVTYWYDSGFCPVKERTRREMDLPGLEETLYVILLPEHDDGGEGTLPEETTPAETKPKETTPAETKPEETTPAETKPEETVPPETSDRPSREDSGGGSVHNKEVRPVQEPAAAAETGAEPPATEETLNGELPPEEGQQAPPEQDQPEADKPEPTDQKETDIREVTITLRETTTDQEGPGQALPDEIITYRLMIENSNEEPMEDMRFRIYLADRTSFISVEGEGVYGVMNGKQYITWNLERIAPGEKQELVFQIKVFPCVPVGYSIDNRVSWQKDDKRSVNHPGSLEHEIVFPEITIR